MAKKKKQPQQVPLSPEKYICLKARKLPIVQCTINENWQEEGIAMITVARQHTNGNYTFAGYLVDVLCLGLKDTYYSFNYYPEYYREMVNKTPSRIDISYDEAHNIIYGAIAFAEEEAGIQPHRDFKITQYLLEEDTDDIPLIEYEFGENGKPVLWTTTLLEASRHLPLLRKKLGEDFEYHIREEEMDEDYDDYEEEDDAEEDYLLDTNMSLESIAKLLNNMKERWAASEALPHTKYSYIPPPYPNALQLRFKELTSLFDIKNMYSLPTSDIEKIIALPREELIKNLNEIILYELGISCNNTITTEMYDQYPNTLTHVLFLIGELKATECLPIVLEILRQNDSSLNYHFEDARNDAFHPTLYYIAREQMEVLSDFMKEPGLDELAKVYVAKTGIYVITNEPERRAEMIEWYRQLFLFFKEHIDDTSVYDASLIGMIVTNLTRIQATELLPEIKELYDTGLVDTMCCGDYTKVAKLMAEESRHVSDDCSLPTIYKRYIDYEKKWKR